MHICIYATHIIFSIHNTYCHSRPPTHPPTTPAPPLARNQGCDPEIRLQSPNSIPIAHPMGNKIVFQFIYSKSLDCRPPPRPPRKHIEIDGGRIFKNSIFVSTGCTSIHICIYAYMQHILYSQSTIHIATRGPPPTHPPPRLPP